MDQCTDILISVRSEFVARILAGEKTVELRRRRLNISAGTRIWIYTKAPQASVQACAVVEGVFHEQLAALWQKFHACAGVTRQEFRAYFGTAEEGCAILLKDVTKLEKEVSLAAIRRKVTSFQPPQFYSKLKRNDAMLRILRSVAH